MSDSSQLDHLELDDTRGEIVLTDSEDEDEFIRKFGDVQFQYIKRPKDGVWFKRPHALNYFKDGVLYRTKGERSSTKTELFLDLMYVGIIANLAGDAVEHAGWGALLKYVILFGAIWTVWCDIKDFTNYYYNEDLSQKAYIVWILALLTLFCNNQTAVLDDRSGAEYVIIPYILCRVSLAISLFIYTFWIPEHRVQQRAYSASLLFTSALWTIVIFVDTRAKIALSIVFLALEQFLFCFCFHPYFKKIMGLTMSTALNIEHEVERFSVFVTIALGEFLYKIVATHDLGLKFQEHLGRGIFLLIDAYVLFWIYSYGSMSMRATHPLRHSGFRAISWIYCHFPLVAALVLAADAGGDLCKLGQPETEAGGLERRAETGEHEEPNVQAIKFFFTGGLWVSLASLGFLGLLDDPKDPTDSHLVPKFWRVIFRFPIGAIILVLPFADISTTLLMGLTSVLLVVLLIWESIMGTPRKFLTFVKTINE